ncbi:FAD-dependent oxidoreductase [Enteractinococcus coprophilus]|uniref:Glycine/D-amino acid oxidase-like deaminating enzyme n=2 Tax=Micrococcales TaxID=85006 RepID=A0A543AN61_9MICC|nr:FAD-dependent oxidoreductase [Enteractinococcus coprophilus]TQL74024.1 glycine/D-amino acid oxidase-like deaminating enzyme [Enteractinococcus coprophilus]
MSPVKAGNSYWMESVPPTSYPTLQDDITVDVCIIGGGITGLLTAFELSEAGQRVAILEAERLASVVTGHTTAKLTSQHGARYARLSQELGADVARSYAQANQDALQRIRDIAAELQIEEAIQTTDAYVYGTAPSSVEALRAEAQAAQDAGLPASFTTDVPVPFETVGAVRFTDQAQLHPRRLLIRLAEVLAERGVQIFESTSANEMSFDDQWTVSSEEGQVRADNVIVAALTPTAGVGSNLFEQMYCHQGFVVAMPLGNGQTIPEGVLISYDRPMRSVRVIERPEGPLLQVTGGAYVENPNIGDEPYDDLEGWAREHFDVGEAEYRWTTQDYSTADGLPLIGSLADDGLYIATGFGGWGLTTAGVAAAIIRDAITQEQVTSQYRDIFDPARELSGVDSALISARTSSGTDRDANEIIGQLTPGDAAVVCSGGEQLAVHRDNHGELNVVSAVCTHLGGIVLWNKSNSQWGCPCHGSKFLPDGSVVNGPAETPLADKKDLLNE